MALMRKEEVQTSGTSSISIGQTHTILGPESFFDGTLTFEGAVRIDGRFKGHVKTDDVLVVGESAEVEAELEVGSLILNGTIRGNVHAKRAVELHAPARLYGNIRTPSLVIHTGVIFEGSCQMENLDQKPPNVLKMKRDEDEGESDAE
jgi:cytoskeletal protein CcmA (bactofilin family)